MLRGDEKLNRVILLVKDGYVVEFFDDRFVGNLPELEEAIKELKYVGYQNFNKVRT
jgi:hypothetical protein